MAWNDYITGFGFDTPNYSAITFTSYTKEEIADTVADISYSTSWRDSSDNEGGIDSFSSTDTKHVIPYHIVFDDNGEISTYGFDVGCSATIYAHTPRWGNYNFSAQYMPLNCRSGYAQDIYSMLNTRSCLISVNVPVIAVKQSTFTNMQQYITQHRSAWISGEEDFWSYYNSIIETENAQWLNVDTEPPTEPEGELFEVYNTGQRGTWSLGDIVTDVSTPFYRWLRVKLATTEGVDGRLAFYKQGLEDGVIKLIPVVTASIVFCEYSTNGSTWQEWTGSGLPFDYIYGERTNELGTFIYATRTGLNGTDGAPVFDDQATATKWVNHDPTVDITDANNYGDLGNRYPIGNKTGLKETDTTMGTASNFKSHFTQKYILDSGDVVKIANAMLDTSSNIFEDIVNGLKMFGESIIDSVCSLVFFPIDLTTVFTRLSLNNHIFFGGYQYPPTGDPTTLQVYRVTGYDGYIDLGTVTIQDTYPKGDYRNTSEYCRVSIFLPYVGLTELSYEKYVGKTLKVRYYLDLNTGSCLVCLLCDDGDGFKLYDYVNGQMGAQIPITLTDSSAYAQAQLRNISSLATSITAGATGLGTGLASRGSGILQQAMNGNTFGAVMEVGAMNAEGAVGALSTGVGFSKAMYDIKQTNINNFKTTKGGSGAIGNQYLPQYVYLIFEYIETEETPNLLQLEGRPSNKSGALDSFSGYLEVDSVKLSCSYATENEKKEIEQLLNTGVYI